MYTVNRGQKSQLTFRDHVDVLRWRLRLDRPATLNPGGLTMDQAERKYPTQVRQAAGKFHATSRREGERKEELENATGRFTVVLK